MVTLKPVHPDRWNPTSTVRKLGIVIHDAESSDGACQALIDVMASPGDRPSSSGGKYGSAYHAVTLNDPANPTYAQVLQANQGPFAAPPLNMTHWHVCMPGRANQGAAGWSDPASQAGIRATAQFVVDKSAVDGIPLVHLTPAQLRAGERGYCGHVDVAVAFPGSTDHTDPGPTFPWAQFDALVQQLAHQTNPDPEESTMLKRIRIQSDDPAQNDAAVFFVDGLTAIWGSAQATAAAEAAGLAPPAAAEVHIAPAALKIYELHGPEPDYSTVNPGVFGHHTHGSDFALWVH